MRATIADGDVYHLTDAPPQVNPTGWMAIEYVAQDGERAVVTAYRLAGGAPDTMLRLRGLRAGATYAVQRDGRPFGSVLGAALMTGGLYILLDAEWRATVVELTVQEDGR